MFDNHLKFQQIQMLFYVSLNTQVGFFTCKCNVYLVSDENISTEIQIQIQIFTFLKFHSTLLYSD